MAWTAILGIVLLIWLAWDLFSGSVWLHREIYREEEPFSYWSVMIIWLVVAVSCFYW